MRFVPMNEWSKDHFSLLAYVETCCVDGQGILDHDRMRTNIPRHPGMAGPRIAMLPRGEGPYKYPTRLRDGKVEADHDEARTLLESIVKRHDEDALRTCVEARWDNDACEAVRALLSHQAELETIVQSFYTCPPTGIRADCPIHKLVAVLNERH